MCTCVENCKRWGAFCLYIVLSQCAVGWQSHSLKKDPSRGALIESSLLLAMGLLNPLQYIHPLGIFCRCDFFFRLFSSDPPSLPGAAVEPWVWGPAPPPPPLSLSRWARGRPDAWRSSKAVFSLMGETAGTSASASHNTATHVVPLMVSDRPWGRNPLMLCWVLV